MKLPSLFVHDLLAMKVPELILRTSHYYSLKAFNSCLFNKSFTAMLQPSLVTWFAVSHALFLPSSVSCSSFYLIRFGDTRKLIFAQRLLNGFVLLEHHIVFTQIQNLPEPTNTSTDESTEVPFISPNKTTLSATRHLRWRRARASPGAGQNLGRAKTTY